MTTNSKKTKDHDTIKDWVEERQGEPAIVEDTGKGGKDGGLLRIKFGKGSDELKPVSWEEFFRIFDQRQLTFLYDTDEGSTFNKFIN